MKTILKFLKPHRSLCFFILLITLGNTLATLFIPTLMADIVNIGVLDGNMEYIYRKGLLMLLCAVMAGVGSVVNGFLRSRLSAKLGEDIRNAVYDKALTFADEDFEKFGTSSLITRSLGDVNMTVMGMMETVDMLLPVPLMCISAVILAFLQDTLMGSILLGVTAVVMIAAFIISKKASVIFVKLHESIDRIMTVIRENISGVRVIRAFNKQTYEEKRMHGTFRDYSGYAVRANYLFMGLESLTMFLINALIIAILWFGGNRVGAGSMEIGDITALTEYASLILFNVMMAQMVMLFLPHCIVCAKRIDEVLSHQPKIKDGNETITEKGENVIDFRGVDFRFSDADEATLTGLDFSLCRGTTTAIIGSTGSGKSTIAKLMLRFHDVTEGEIRMGDRDIRTITQSELRRNISYVPQKAWLFSGTIADNLRYGNQNATEEEMQTALHTAQADFVSEFADGLNSHVAQGGFNFSGGQKQRLAIARALIKKADLYIFDDSFSALDFKTDAALRKALKTAVSDSAVLIIAQRVSTIMGADQIIVLEEGKVVGLGRHEELLESCPTYRDIAASQTRGGGINGR